MEIISLQKLWKLYNPTMLPLSTTVISDKTQDGTREIKAFYHGRSTNDGDVRVFVTAFVKEGAALCPAIVMMKDTDEKESEDVSEFVNLGYAVIVPDYLGEGSGRNLHTFYPDSLSNCNIDSSNSFEELKPDIRKSQWIVWTEICLRGITFAESLDFVDKKRICLLGVGTGSSIVIKAAGIDSRVKCTISIFSSGFSVSNIDDTGLQYKASVVDAAYAPLLKAPLLMLLSSNEYNNSLNDMLEVYLRFPPNLARLSISEKCGHEIGFRQHLNVDIFINDCFKGAFDKVPACPQIDVSVSDGALFYTVNSSEKAEIELFSAVDKTNARMRNWHTESNVVQKGNEATFKVEVFNTEITLLAFANAHFKSGYSFSSLVLFKNLAGTGVRGSHLSLKRLIYDNDMGTDDWLSGTAERAPYHNITMEQGPHGITGVAAKNGNLSTLKIGDAQYHGEDGLSLQITAYSPVKQVIKLTVTTYDKNSMEYVTFSATAAVDPFMEWTQLLFGELDFKANGSKVMRWKNVEMLNIESSTPVLVSSMLWT